MFSAIFSKLVAEGLLSLYPIFVKNIGLPLSLQVWSRVFSYTAISAFFIDYPFVLQNLFVTPSASFCWFYLCGRGCVAYLFDCC